MTIDIDLRHKAVAEHTAPRRDVYERTRIVGHDAEPFPRVQRSYRLRDELDQAAAVLSPCVKRVHDTPTHRSLRLFGRRHDPSRSYHAV